MIRDVDNRQDLMDSRDVIERIDELEDIIAENSEKFDISSDAVDELHELEVLKALAEEAAGYASDWQYGETLIRDSYFEEYAEQLADDLGLHLQQNSEQVQWPGNHIDWTAAAEELQQDYTIVDFDGVEYWVRAS